MSVQDSLESTLDKPLHPKEASRAIFMGTYRSYIMRWTTAAVPRQYFEEKCSFRSSLPYVLAASQNWSETLLTWRKTWHRNSDTSDLMVVMHYFHKLGSFEEGFEAFAEPLAFFHSSLRSLGEHAHPYIS